MKDNTKKTVLIMILVFMAAITAILTYQTVSSDEGTSDNLITFEISSPVDSLHLIPQRFDKDCTYYHNNLTENERVNYREGTTSGVQIPASESGRFYQFCKSVNDTAFYRSDVFAAYTQQNGTAFPSDFKLWLETKENIITVGKINVS